MLTTVLLGKLSVRRINPRCDERLKPFLGTHRSHSFKNSLVQFQQLFPGNWVAVGKWSQGFFVRFIHKSTRGVITFYALEPICRVYRIWHIFYPLALVPRTPAAPQPDDTCRTDPIPPLGVAHDRLRS